MLKRSYGGGGGRGCGGRSQRGVVRRDGGVDGGDIRVQSQQGVG